MKKIGKIIKERRKSLKVNQLELSELAGVGISWWPSSVEKAILNW
jgi:transcriptional regulator with XRE-family HTH domain